MSVMQMNPRVDADVWRRAVVRRVLRLGHDADGAVALRLAVDGWTWHRPGEYVRLRLDTPSGPVVTRRFGIVSAPHDTSVELLVDRVEDGDGTANVRAALEPGCVVDMSCPLGIESSWDGMTRTLAIGEGAGIAPLVSMLRLARHTWSAHRLQLVVSGPTYVALPYADELADRRTRLVLHEEDSADGRPAGAIVRDDLAPWVVDPELFLVCGTAGFVESTSTLLAALGVPGHCIRTQRFDPIA
jgi:ferredoxin-NADP reductase